jgi:hypothetical protein
MGRGIECSGLDAGPENDCVIRALLGWFIGGSVLATLAFTLLAVGALVLGLLCRRYLHSLGPTGTTLARAKLTMDSGIALPKATWRYVLMPSGRRGS